jgi:hypothetical protein
MINKFIFEEEASYLLEDKLIEIEHCFESEKICSAVGEIGNTLKDLSFNDRAVSGDVIDMLLVCLLLSAKPDLYCYSSHNEELNTECSFYAFDVDFFNDHNNIIMIKNTMQWTNQNNYLCEIWSIYNKSIQEISNHIRSYD